MLVNERLSTLFTGVTAEAASTFNSEYVIELHADLEDNYLFNMIIGTLKGIAKYADVDLYYNSNNQKPGTPRTRNFLDSILGNETIAKRNRADILSDTDGSQIFSDSTKEYLGLFDGTMAIVGYEQRNANKNVTYRDNPYRADVLQLVNSMGHRKSSEASRALKLIAIG